MAEKVNTIVKVNSEPRHPKDPIETTVGHHHEPVSSKVSIKLTKKVYENKTTGNFIRREKAAIF